MKSFSRRSLLRAGPAALSLPWLEAMLPRRVTRTEPVRRLAFCYVPNGIHMPAWTPADDQPLEPGGALPPLLEPLRSVSDKLLVVSGATNDKARANGDGPGDHARACASFLTCAQPFKSATKIHVGPSIDQLLAAELGGATRLRSLVLGAESSRRSGQCDSGYACAYSGNLSWSTPRTPVTKEIDPLRVFERMFLTGNSRDTPEQARARASRRTSVLDWVRSEARSLSEALGSHDRHKLDEYLTAVRELERRIQSARDAEANADGAARPDLPAGAEHGVPSRYADHVDLMYELLALAFQTDTTRIATYLVANEGSNRSYVELDVTEGHHTLSHHGGDEHKQEQIERINRFHVERFAHFIQRLAATPDGPEGNGTLLDHSLILYGSGIADGNRHNHDDLPVLVAGGGGGSLTTGRHLRVPHATPLADLHLALAQRLGLSTLRLGDGRGPLDLG